MTFRFKLTPKGNGKRPNNVPLANEDGSVDLLKAAETTDQASGLPNIPLPNQRAVRKLLESTLFILDEKQMPKIGETKTLDLGIVASEKLNTVLGQGKKLTTPMADEEGRFIEGKREDGMEQFRWRVVVKPAGSMGTGRGSVYCLVRSL
jgi:hypothetical protein